MPQWHIDYFDLKLLKKQLMQEGCSEPPPLSPLKVENKSLKSKVRSLYLEVKQHPYHHQREEPNKAG